jgi:Fe2+ or Zn2+ uptake regulation protein
VLLCHHEADTIILDSCGFLPTFIDKIVHITPCKENREGYGMKHHALYTTGVHAVEWEVLVLAE